MKTIVMLTVGWLAGATMVVAILMHGEFEQRQGWPKP